MFIYLLKNKDVIIGLWMKMILSHWNFTKVETFVISILIGLYKIWIKPIRWYLNCIETLIGFHIINSWKKTDWMSFGNFSEEFYTSTNRTDWLYLSLSDLFFFFVCVSVTTIRVSQRDRKIISSSAGPPCSLRRDSGSLSFVLFDLSSDDLDLW